MRKTKPSFDLVAQQHGNDGLFASFYRPPGSAILLQSRSQRRPSPRLSASASHHLSLYQDKAVTPTPLKDIFTPIWAGPSSSSRESLPSSRQIEMKDFKSGDEGFFR